jgi:hypothetical protein
MTAEEPQAEMPTAGGGNVTINNKKVISPINDLSKTGPNLNQLLQAEENQGGVSTPPATSVVSPGGQTVTPATPNGPTNSTNPGNVINPGDIAL